MSLKHPAWISALASAIPPPAARTSPAESPAATADSPRSDPAGKATDGARGEAQGRLIDFPNRNRRGAADAE